MTKTGNVRGIRGGTVIVAQNISAGCFGCLKEECRNVRRFITAENPETLPLETGQMVEVSAQGIAFFGQALVSLLPPIIGFIAGYALARLLVPGAGEGAFAGTGAILLFAAAFAVYKARAKFPAKKVYKVTKIL